MRTNIVKLFSLLCLATVAGTSGKAQTAPAETPVAIVYDGAAGPKDYQSKGYIHALFIENLVPTPDARQLAQQVFAGASHAVAKTAPAV